MSKEEICSKKDFPLGENISQSEADLEVYLLDDDGICMMKVLYIFFIEEIVVQLLWWIIH